MGWIEWVFALLIGALIGLGIFSAIQETKRSGACKDQGGIYYYQDDSCWKVPGAERIGL